MDETQQIAKLFENHRRHLQAVAYRMLGSFNEADDAVQETWLRLNRSDAESIENLQGWLTTVVARVCLDMLRSRKSRREEALEDQVTDPTADSDAATDPEQEALMADSVGVALLVMLDTLSPAERVAFVLHDVFDLPFEEIAPIVGRTPAAARQLASRARRRVRSQETTPESDLKGQRIVVNAFLSALRAGDFQGLLAVLDPDVLVRFGADAGAPGTPSEVRGAANWARGAVAFSHMARTVQPALVNGAVGLALFAPSGNVTRALSFTIVNGKIAEMEIIADPERLEQLNVAALTE